MRKASSLTLVGLGITGLLACSASVGDGADLAKPLSGASSGSGSDAGGVDARSGSDAKSTDGGIVCPTGSSAGNANGVCSSDTSWRSQAESSCKSEGYELGTFTPSESCGKGSSDSASWTCCTAAPPLEPTCSIHELTSSCTTASALESQAKTKCAAEGDVLETFVANDACKGGQSSAASYTCCPSAEPALGAFPPPPTSPDDAPEWAFYDNPQAMSVFKNFALQDYNQFSAREGQTFSATITAMVSSEVWAPDPSKQIDGAIFEGELKGGSYVWTQIARGSSEGGVLDLTARSGGSDRIHVVAIEASPSSYPSGVSPAVSTSLDLTCATGDHADCALGGEPGDSCTVSPASCDGPVTWCFSPLGACSNHGTCQRIDIGCPGIYDPVCTCAGTTEINSCYATVDKESIAHDGSCDSDAGGGGKDGGVVHP
jgi:hypothetical protein